MAAKLARLVYRMLCYGMKCVDQGAALYQAQHRQLQIKQSEQESHQSGISIHPSSSGLKSTSFGGLSPTFPCGDTITILIMGQFNSGGNDGERLRLAKISN
jgi:hypothetical protein